MCSVYFVINISDIDPIKLNFHYFYSSHEDFKKTLLIMTVLTKKQLLILFLFLSY